MIACCELCRPDAAAEILGPCECAADYCLLCQRCEAHCRCDGADEPILASTSSATKVTPILSEGVKS